VKPFSLTCRSVDGRSLLKVYRGIQPPIRRDHETEALRLAAEWSLPVPRVLATGTGRRTAWTVFRAVDGVPGDITTRDGVRSFISRTRTTAQLLQDRARGLAPGLGWAPTPGPPISNSDFLLDQFSDRCRQRNWWTELEAVIKSINLDPTVYLHGDFKPEHFLANRGRLHVVDWEASARGPAQCDYADAVFHLVRDLIYMGKAPDQLPISTICSLPVGPGVLVWRLLRWLDRRRPNDIDAITPYEIRRLANAVTPAALICELARLIAKLRAQGTPR